MKIFSILFLFPILLFAQNLRHNGNLSTAGGLVSGDKFSSISIVGQATPIGIAEGQNFFIGSGFINIISTEGEDIVSAIELTENDLIPNEFSLQQNYPNPFNPLTTIKYDIKELTMVELKVFDILGREVATLVNDEKPVGYYEIKFNASNLPSGIYFYRLKAGSYIETKKMVLMK
jgi:hypothetical protein